MHGSAVRIETVAGPARLVELRDEWLDLGRSAGEPNIFYEPMAMLPALDSAAAEGIFCLLLWGADNKGRRRLDGLLPLKRWRRSRALPRGIESWDYPLRSSGEPLIRAGREHAFWSAMLPELDELGGLSFLRLALLHADSRSTRALVDVARELERPLYVTRRLDRAALEGGSSVEDYLGTLPPKQIREQKRRRKRLAELGEARFEQLEPGGDASEWIEALIRLEGLGWKGRRGVAAGSEPSVEAFVRRLLSEAHGAGRLDMRRLRLNGETISILAHIETGRTAVSFKISYDEAYARYSPGVLLQMDYLGHALGLDWVDSCATPGHPMFDRIWTGRRPIVSLMIPFDRPSARLACAVEQGARKLLGRLRRRAPAAAGRSLGS